MANAVTRNAVGFCSTWWSPDGGGARKWLWTSLCALPHSSSSCLHCSGTWGALCVVLSWGLRHITTRVWEWQVYYLVGGKVFAKRWSSQGIHKIQSASIDSHPLFQWRWSVRSCASQRPLPPGFVTSELGACTASRWCCSSRACPSSWPPAEVWGTPLALKKSLTSEMQGKQRLQRRAVAKCSYTWLGLSGMWGRLLPLRMWLGFEADRWTRWQFL